MKRYSIILGLIALCMSSCSKQESTSSSAVLLDVARLGTRSDIDAGTFENGDALGVFAYELNSSNEVPSYANADFMCNQKVDFIEEDALNAIPAKWEYAPLKYWPIDNTKLRFFGAFPHSPLSRATAAGPLFEWELDGMTDVMIPDEDQMPLGLKYLDGSLTTHNNTFHLRHGLQRLQWHFFSSNGAYRTLVVDSAFVRKGPARATYNPLTNQELQFSNDTDGVYRLKGSSFKICSDEVLGDRYSMVIPYTMTSLECEFYIGRMRYFGTVDNIPHEGEGWNTPGGTLVIDLEIRGVDIQPDLTISSWIDGWNGAGNNEQTVGRQ